jgi:hypothetical protein
MTPFPSPLSLLPGNWLVTLFSFPFFPSCDPFFLPQFGKGEASMNYTACGPGETSATGPAYRQQLTDYMDASPFPVMPKWLMTPFLPPFPPPVRRARSEVCGPWGGSYDTRSRIGKAYDPFSEPRRAGRVQPPTRRFVEVLPPQGGIKPSQLRATHSAAPDAKARRRQSSIHLRKSQRQQRRRCLASDRMSPAWARLFHHTIFATRYVCGSRRKVEVK